MLFKRPKGASLTLVSLAHLWFNSRVAERVEIPARLRAWREHHKISQKQAAERLDMPFGTYLTYESGRRGKGMAKFQYDRLIRLTTIEGEAGNSTNDAAGGARN